MCALQHSAIVGECICASVAVWVRPNAVSEMSCSSVLLSLAVARDLPDSDTVEPFCNVSSPEGLTTPLPRLCGSLQAFCANTVVCSAREGAAVV